VIFTDECNYNLMNYSGNSFFAIKISLLNHIAQLCEGMGTGMDIVLRLIGSGDRNEKRSLILGIGYGALIFISL
jgi:UDPglucose 6-dehydrogenase